MDENTGDEMLNIKSVNSRVLASEMMLVARVGWEVWLGHLLVAVCVASLPLMWLSGGCTYYHDSHRLVTNHACIRLRHQSQYQKWEATCTRLAARLM